MARARGRARRSTGRRGDHPRCYRCDPPRDRRGGRAGADVRRSMAEARREWIRSDRRRRHAGGVRARGRGRVDAPHRPRGAGGARDVEVRGMSDRNVDAVFSALSDPTRRGVIRALSEDGPSTVSELASRLPVTRQAVTKHLEALEDAGLVAATTEGRGRRYRLTPGPMTRAMSWMADVGAEWDARLEDLRRHLARRRG